MKKKDRILHQFQEIKEQFSEFKEDEKDEILIAPFYLNLDELATSLRDLAYPELHLAFEKCAKLCQGLLLSQTEYSISYPILKILLDKFSIDVPLLFDSGKLNSGWDDICRIISEGLNNKRDPLIDNFFIPPQADVPVEQVELIEETPSTESNDYKQYEKIIQFIDEERKEFLIDFIVETRELVTYAETELLHMEKSQQPSSQSIKGLFRAFHTIKGNSSFLSLDELSGLTHRAEEIFAKYIQSGFNLNKDFFDTFFSVVRVNHQFIDQLEQIANGLPLTPVDASQAFQKIYHFLENMPEPVVFEEQVEETPDKEEEKPQPIEELKRPATTQPPPETKKAEKSTVEAIAETIKNNLPPNPKQEKRSEPARFEKIDYVRVPAFKLDVLAELIGEMVISISLVSQKIEKKIPISKEEFHDVERLMETLWNRIIDIRMFPLKSVFIKLQSQVRELSEKLKKQINMNISGEDTLVDKSVIDDIYSPLMHMVRNSIDHGIEDVETRKAQGKTEAGNISITADHIGDTIIIKCIDDGKGLDYDSIYKKAIERELIDTKIQLTRNEVFSMIFNEGFSTAAQVTDVSGRGIGMDVVKKSIEALKGSIMIESEKHKGTEFIITLPVSTSILEGLVIQLDGDYYIFPVSFIEQIVTISPAIIEIAQDRNPFFLHQDRPVSLIHLSNFFEFTKTPLDFKAFPKDSLFPVIIFCYQNRRYGFIVDQLIRCQKVVVKNLGESFSFLKEVSGGTILGDGSIGLILNPLNMIRQITECHHKE